MTYQFGAFEFDDRSLELRKNGRLVAIEPQPARALALLLSRAGEVVTREELKHAVWGADTHVDFDRGLAYCLSQVRAALGDKGDNPRFVQTLPRKGYCFVAPVRTSDEAVGATPVANVDVGANPRHPSRRPTWLAAAALLLALAAGVGWFIAGRATGASRSVIAVSIFDNETGNAEYDRLVAGLSDLGRRAPHGARALAPRGRWQRRGASTTAQHSQSAGRGGGCSRRLRRARAVAARWRRPPLHHASDSAARRDAPEGQSASDARRRRLRPRTRRGSRIRARGKRACTGAVTFWELGIGSWELTSPPDAPP